MSTSDLLVALGRVGGVERFGALIGPGITKRTLARAVRDGNVHRSAPGLYSLPDCPRDVLRAAELHGRLTCMQGAEALGLWVLHRSQRLHVACARARSSPGVVVHRRGASLEPTLPWVESADAVVEHALRCLPELDALVITESALFTSAVQRDVIEARFRGRRDAPQRRVLALLDTGSQSVLETVARYHLVRARFGVRTQAPISGLGHVDLLVDDRVAVELHGERYHNNRAQFAEDLRRANAAALAGVPLLQYGGSTLLQNPAAMVREVGRILGSEYFSGRAR